MRRQRPLMVFYLQQRWMAHALIHSKTFELRFGRHTSWMKGKLTDGHWTALCQTKCSSATKGTAVRRDEISETLMRRAGYTWHSLQQVLKDGRQRIMMVARVKWTRVLPKPPPGKSALDESLTEQQRKECVGLDLDCGRALEIEQWKGAPADRQLLVVCFSNLIEIRNGPSMRKVPGAQRSVLDLPEHLREALGEAKWRTDGATGQVCSPLLVNCLDLRTYRTALDLQGRLGARAHDVAAPVSAATPELVG